MVKIVVDYQHIQTYTVPPRESLAKVLNDHFLLGIQMAG
jgi:hypothetical protein